MLAAVLAIALFVGAVGLLALGTLAFGRGLSASCGGAAVGRCANCGRACAKGRKRTDG